jgi:hypothetical protein
MTEMPDNDKSFSVYAEPIRAASGLRRRFVDLTTKNIEMLVTVARMQQPTVNIPKLVHL